MKRTVSFVLAMIMTAAIIFSGSALASDADAIFAIGNAEGKPGETVEISVTLKANKEINSIAFHDIAYDAAKVEFVGFSDYEHLDAKSVMPIENFVDAEKKAILVPLKASEKFDGELCKLRFRIKDDATNGKSLVNASSVIKNDSDKGVSIVNGGYVTVTGGAEPETDAENGASSGAGSSSSAGNSSGAASGSVGGGKAPASSSDSAASVIVPSNTETTGEKESKAPRFKDLLSHAWAADAINALAAEGIIRGTSETTFAPAANITRADFAILLVRAFELASDNEENFADVKPSDYFAKELAIARNTGIINGIGENKFAPKNNITRQDMMVIVYRVLKSRGFNESTAELTAPDFASVAGYAREAVSALVNAGLVNGKNGLIAPKDNTTRAEVAVLIKRIVDYSTK